MSRTAQHVFQSHLDLRKQGQTDEDIRQNYAKDVVILANDGTYYGHSGVEESATLLQSRLPDAQFSYHTQLVHENAAFLVWSAASPNKKVCHGADSFLIEDGLIKVQTIYYKVEK